MRVFPFTEREGFCWCPGSLLLHCSSALSLSLACAIDFSRDSILGGSHCFVTASACTPETT